MERGIYMEIRLANRNEAKELSYLKKAIWETTYRGIYPDEVIDNYDYKKREEKFMYLISDDNQEVYVCEIDGKIIGYMVIGEPLHGKLEGYELTINDLGIDKQYRGMGIGKSFLNIAKSKNKKLFNCCNYYNENARKFYEKNNGVIVKKEMSEDKRHCQVYYVYDM